VYEALRGRLLVREPTSAVLECGGVSYRVLIPLSTYEALPAPGAEARLLVHLAVREDEWRLFGFGSEEERLTFRRLLGVIGVGPVLALSLLSGLKPRELRAAVASGDLKALCKVKGVGRKTAERVALELRDAWSLAESVSGEDAPAGAKGDALRALLSLGLDAAEARRRLDAVPEADGKDAGELVRRALRS
jgi:Holliday junction DNA helicase RuvA